MSAARKRREALKSTLQGVKAAGALSAAMALDLMGSGYIVRDPRSGPSDPAYRLTAEGENLLRWLK